MWPISHLETRYKTDFHRLKISFPTIKVDLILIFAQQLGKLNPTFFVV